MTSTGIRVANSNFINSLLCKLIMKILFRNILRTFNLFQIYYVWKHETKYQHFCSFNFHFWKADEREDNYQLTIFFFRINDKRVWSLFCVWCNWQYVSLCSLNEKKMLSIHHFRRWLSPYYLAESPGSYVEKCCVLFF